MDPGMESLLQNLAESGLEEVGSPPQLLHSQTLDNPGAKHTRFANPRSQLNPEKPMNLGEEKRQNPRKTKTPKPVEKKTPKPVEKLPNPAKGEGREELSGLRWERE